MPQSLVKNYIHLTFSTKNRYPFINEEIKEELFKYLGGICKHQQCNPIIVGGYLDHVHILCVLSRKIALMDLVKKVKSNSSKWMKTKGVPYQKFYWQNGYFGISVDPLKLRFIENYIKRQVEHHKTVSFKDEYLTFLRQYEVSYDERYVWD